MSERNRKPRNPLRTPENMFEEDEGNLCYSRLNRITGEKKDHSIHMLHEDLKGLRLNENVPTEVVDQFDLARNLCLYGWYQYSFGMAAQLYGHIAVEHALRMKRSAVVGPSKKHLGLRKLCLWAIESGFIKDGGFTHLFFEDPETGEKLPARRQDLTPDGTTYSREAFADTYLRNNLAHGSTMLMPPFAAVASLRISADAINQLFAD